MFSPVFTCHGHSSKRWIFVESSEKEAEGNFRKDTVLFAFFWCAIHPGQRSSDTAEQLQTKQHEDSDESVTDWGEICHSRGPFIYGRVFISLGLLGENRRNSTVD